MISSVFLDKSKQSEVYCHSSRCTSAM